MPIGEHNQKRSSSWPAKASLQKLWFSVHPNRSARATGQREGDGDHFVHHGLIIEFDSQIL